MKFVTIISMKTKFEILKQIYGTHKAAAKELGVSYTRYNQWRWDPEKMPTYSKKLVELAVEVIRHKAA